MNPLTSWIVGAPDIEAAKPGYAERLARFVGANSSTPLGIFHACQAQRAEGLKMTREERRKLRKRHRANAFR